MGTLHTHLKPLFPRAMREAVPRSLLPRLRDSPSRSNGPRTCLGAPPRAVQEVFLLPASDFGREMTKLYWC